MSGPEGYTGPTSGRITVGGDGSVNRERFYDRPLTREEREAVKWFTDLSPNEQLREVRRLKFDLESARQDRDAWKSAVQRSDAANRRLAAERDARRPGRDWNDAPPFKEIHRLLALPAEE